MHCASLGEFEQGRPVLEALRRERPDWQVLLTFFSPSGYERCKNEPLADRVAYLPADGPGRAKAWVERIRPDVAIFVKYEFWFFHLRALHHAGVPTFLIAASFRPSQPFFRFWGGWWRRMLGFFELLIVQTAADKELLQDKGQLTAGRLLVAGDPRMDRTLQVAEAPFADSVLDAFSNSASGPILMAGSVWPEDVAILLEALPQLPPGLRIVLAPHQLHESELEKWCAAFGAYRYTRAEGVDPARHRVLIMDTIGILSRAYRYADLAYVGGAFRTGLHNTLEPMAHGLPVIFGPRHQKFPEAGVALARGGAFVVTKAEELRATIVALTNTDVGSHASTAQLALAEESAGASLRIAAAILEELRERR